MSLTVKAYVGDFDRESTSVEIRRFAIDDGASTNYDYMCTKLTQVFPSLNGKRFKTFWRDPDNDYVAFSSGEELVEALGFVTDGVFRVFIRPESDDSKAFHPGVVCDACNGPIYGNRYKCTVCRDYDLCSGCEEKGNHNQHVMMRLCTSEQRMDFPFRGFMGMFGPPGHDGPPHPGPPGPHSGPPSDEGPPHIPHWRRMRQMWRRWWRENMGYPGGQGSGEGCGYWGGRWGGRMGRRGSGQKTEQDVAGKAREEETNEKDGTTEGGQEESPTEDYLKNVGDSVAAMLDPLGIDVEIDVEHKGRRFGCKRGRPGHCGGRRGRGGAWGCYPPGIAHYGGQMFPEETSSSQSSMSSTQSTNAGCQGKDIDMDQAPEKASKPGPSTDKPSQDVPMSPENHEQGDVEWTMVEPATQREGAREETAGPSAPAQTNPNLYPRIPEERTVEPHIADALSHMLSMGFTNDDGWLTHLLEEKRGNISQALDSIQQASRGK